MPDVIVRGDPDRRRMAQLAPEIVLGGDTFTDPEPFSPGRL
jgi:hypothetical protein